MHIGKVHSVQVCQHLTDLRGILQHSPGSLGQVVQRGITTQRLCKCTTCRHLQRQTMLLNIRDLKQWERWCLGRLKWRPEVHIFSLPVLWLNKFVQPELKQGHSDSLCETKVFHQARHRTSGCYSWCQGDTAVAFSLFKLTINNIYTVNRHRNCNVTKFKGKILLFGYTWPGYNSPQILFPSTVYSQLKWKIITTWLKTLLWQQKKLKKKKQVRKF